jgi:hypothetical protein
MRKLYFFPVWVLSSLVLLSSCSKKAASDAVAPMNPSVVNVNIGANVSYQLPLDNSGVVSISKQASHYQVSHTTLDNKSGMMVYEYVPATDFQGTDEVVLSKTSTSVVTGSECANNHSSNSQSTVTITSYTLIKINVSN